MSMLARRTSLWLLVAAWAGVIFFMSSIPGSSIPGHLPAEVGHFGEYLIFGALLYLALRANLSPGAAVAAAVIIASIYGMTDEFHQSFVLLRTPDAYDWGVDTLGAVTGAFLARSLDRSARRGRAADAVVSAGGESD
jgi:VanZ family protein